MKLHCLSSGHEHTLKLVYDKAMQKHNNTGCTYGVYSYDLHINAVVNVARQYLYLLDEEEKITALLACVCHDLIEDCRMSYNAVSKMTNSQVADIVYNVTNELGKNRKEKAEKTYPKIKGCKLSTFVKLCDRIANMKFSYFMNDGDGMFVMYVNEFPEFYKALYDHDMLFKPMWEELTALTLR